MILVVDIRDTFFQANPFADVRWLGHHGPTQVLLFPECLVRIDALVRVGLCWSALVCVGQRCLVHCTSVGAGGCQPLCCFFRSLSNFGAQHHGMGRIAWDWMTKCWPEDRDKTLVPDRYLFTIPMICSGGFVGTFRGIHHVVKEMATEIRLQSTRWCTHPNASNDKSPGWDQGFLNRLFYRTQRLQVCTPPPPPAHTRTHRTCYTHLVSSAHAQAIRCNSRTTQTTPQQHQATRATAATIHEPEPRPRPRTRLTYCFLFFFDSKTVAFVKHLFLLASSRSRVTPS